MSENLSKLSARKGLKENLFEAIQEYTADPDNIKQIAKSWKIGEAPVYSAATSYDFITGNQANKKAYVCNGSSCLCAGEQDQVSEKLSECFGAENIGHMTCLGRCHENAAFHINGVNYSGDAINHLDDILDNQTAKTDNLSHDNYAVTALTETPILTKPIGNLSDFYQLFNELIQQFSREDLLKQMIESGLRGRGGAGFPAGIKWQSCAQIIDDQKYIVCNADEGDPGAFSDRYLLEQQPHLVLFGMLISGYLVGANHGVLYIRAEYPDSIAMTNQAIKDFEQLNILPADFDFKFKVVAGAGAYICGEETALLRSLEGQKPMVSVRPPFPTVKGLFGKPTVVNNVETFASVHWILTQGAEAYKQIGNGKSTGTKLVCLDGQFVKSGIYEVEMGFPLKQLIEAAGGFKNPVKALHIGGPLGGIVPMTKADQLTVDFESFASNGFLLGHASIVAIPESQNMIEYLHHLFEFTAAESCGKCFPCRLGATRGKEMFANAIDGKHLINRDLLDDLLETMEKGSLCALGGGIPLPVKNALNYFYDELKTGFEAI